MIAAAVKTLAQIFSPPFRGVLFRALGLTLAILAAIWVGLYALFDWFLLDWLAAQAPALATVLQVLAGVGLLIGLGFLIAPVTSLFAGLFLDEIAEEVEKAYYPLDPPGRSMPMGESIATAVRFTALVVAVNLVVLVLVLLPGVNVALFFIANAYLLGREYFEAVAARFHDREAVAELRAQAGARMFLAGLVIAFVLAIPIVNLLTPLFATAFMVHVFKGVEVDAIERARAQGE